MEKTSFEQKLLILAIVFLPINNFHISLPIIGSILSYLFLLLGVLFFVYKTIIEKEGLESDERFFIYFLGVLMLWKCICSILGTYEYSFNHLIWLEQIEKLKYLLQSFHDFGIEIDDLTALKIWIGIRAVKNSILDIFLTYGVSVWVYHLYIHEKNESGEKTVFFSHIIFAVCVLCSTLILYSFFEIGYLRGNRFCANLLSMINPLLYEVKAVHGWWPPLLWKNQLRSLFAEPSFFGIGSTFVIPFLFYKMLKSKNKGLFFVVYGIFIVMLFMTRARTAVVLFLMQCFLFLVYAFGFNKKYIKNTLKILCVSGVSFYIALSLMSGFKPISDNSYGVPSLQSTAFDYVNDNIISIVGNKRSNSARVANIRATFLTGFQHPLFGVGMNLTSAYVNDNLTEEDLMNEEVRNWSKYMREDGAIKSPIPVLNQFSNEIAYFGIPGLVLYILPMVFILQRLIKLLKSGLNLEIACVSIAYMSSLVAMLSNVAFFTYYVLTGLMLKLLHNEAKGEKKVMKLIDAINIIQKKARYIFLIAILGALCTSTFKYFFTPGISINGDFLCDRIIQIEDVRETPNTIIEFNYSGIINTNVSFLKFIERTDGKVFDYSRINSSWKRINRQQKVEWLRKRFKIYSFHDNVYEIAFAIPSSNISDLAYLENNINTFMDEFLDNSEGLIREIKSHAVIRTVNSTVISPEKIRNDKKRIALKYAFYGFIAGIFLSSAYLLGMPLFRDLQS